MKKISLVFSVLFCFFIIFGMGLATRNGWGTNVKNTKPVIEKRKVPTSFTFTVTDNTTESYSYLFGYPASLGGVFSPGTNYVTLPVGTYYLNLGPTNGPNPPRVDFLFNNGVGWPGDPGHNFSSVDFGTGTGEASSLTINYH